MRFLKLLASLPMFSRISSRQKSLAFQPQPWCNLAPDFSFSCGTRSWSQNGRGHCPILMRLRSLMAAGFTSEHETHNRSTFAINVLHVTLLSPRKQESNESLKLRNAPSPSTIQFGTIMFSHHIDIFFHGEHLTTRNLCHRGPPHSEESQPTLSTEAGCEFVLWAKGLCHKRLCKSSKYAVTL